MGISQTVNHDKLMQVYHRLWLCSLVGCDAYLLGVRRLLETDAIVLL